MHQVREACQAVRPARRAPVASPRHRVRQAHAGVRAAARDMRGSRRDRRDDAVGQTQERVHARFRTADGASERARAQKRGEPADAHGLEERGPGMQTGRRRPASGAGPGLFDGPRSIGVDETSYRKGHKYMTVVVDHDRGASSGCIRVTDRRCSTSLSNCLCMGLI